jgi:hypothetical protein
MEDIHTVDENVSMRRDSTIYSKEGDPIGYLG